ncbi:MAG: hypothetical protein WH035_07220, partial [Spirochaetota bacterium]
ANRVGVEKIKNKSLKFTGKSQIVDPSGKRLKILSSTKEMVGIIEINPELANNKQITPKNNVLLDRRPDQYKL